MRDVEADTGGGGRSLRDCSCEDVAAYRGAWARTVLRMISVEGSSTIGEGWGWKNAGCFDSVEEEY